MVKETSVFCRLRTKPAKFAGKCASAALGSRLLADFVPVFDNGHSFAFAVANLRFLWTNHLLDGWKLEL